MPKVPEMNKPMPEKPKSVMYVCTRGNKPLTPEDQKALEEFMQYRIDKAKKKKARSNQ